MKSNRRSILKAFGLAPILPFIRIGNTSINGNPECITSDDIEGPFYISGAPKSEMIASENAVGTKLFITGTIYYNNCETNVANAEVDVWHASDEGGYFDDDYRGIVNSTPNGGYSFQTVIPGKYLNGAQFRPRHLHYKIRSAEHELTTQIYFQGDTSIPIDPWASQDDAADRIIPLVEDAQGAMHGVVDIYLDLEPIISNTINSKEAKSSAIQFIGSESYGSTTAIKFNLVSSGKVDLFIYDINGRPVATLIQQENMPIGDHSFQFNMRNQLDLAIPSGIYIARLSVDNQAIDAKRFFVVR